ncbi:MAG: hypothetical protein ACI4JC_01145 [Faecalibacterium sp.]
MNEKGEITGGSMYRVEIIAKLFGVTVRRIQQLTQEGVLPTTETPEGRRYDLVPTIQKYVKYLSDKAYGKNRSEKEMELREQKMKADIALKESQGELHRLRTDIAAGKYIDIEEVSLDYSRFFVTFKKFAMSIPSRMTSMISGYVDPLEARRIEKELQGEIQKLLAAFVVAGVTELPPKNHGKE